MTRILQNILATSIFALLLTFSLCAKTKTPVNESPINGATGITSTCTFTWSLSGHGSTPDSFEIQISECMDFTSIAIDIKNISGLYKTLDLSCLSGGTMYYWRIIATKNDHQSSTSDYTSFSTESTMPVELTSFSGSVANNIVTLKWSTATEVNNYGFDVERSSGSGVWSKIGFVSGSGNSNSPKNYSFEDEPNGSSSFSYRIKQIDNNGAFKYYDVITISIAETDNAKLLQNSPNPFNPSTIIKFYVPQTMNVTLKIYDILGKEVTTLVNEQENSGYHIVYWNGRDSYGNSVSSGVYLYRLAAGNFVQTKKMNLLK